MSHKSNLFSRVPIDLPGKSGFNLDHENLFTATCGTLTPAYCKPMLPNDTVSMGVNFQCQLPPMVTDFYGKVDAVFEAFFVPNRILWGGWEDFITHPTKNPVYPSGTNVAAKPSRKPTVVFNDTRFAGPCTLSDYLGFKFVAPTGSTIASPESGFDALPFFAYHMIYHHWYRDSRIQAPVFIPMTPYAGTLSPAYCPSISVTSSTNTAAPSYQLYAGTSSSALGDGVSLGALRQRNWSKGYFTACSPYPQAGGESEITFDTAESGAGAISISALRSANSLQLWMERNNFSYEYGDQIYGQYGIYPDSAKMDKPIFLGRVVEPVYTRSVMQSYQASDADDINSVVGSKKGSSQSIGEGRLFDNFTASEHGFLFVMFSLVPHSYYGTGIARHLYETDAEDVPFPLLAGMGDQEIYHQELVGSSANTADLTVFGYLDRYAHYKYDEDEVHGLLRAGSSLANYALSRDFDSLPDLSSAFLQIPKEALDEVQAVSTATQGFSCWVDAFFKSSKVSTLPAYSVPTLASLRDAQPTRKGHVSRGGSAL